MNKESLCSDNDKAMLKVGQSVLAAINILF